MKSAKKRFGQNFLHDDSVITQIIQVIAPHARDHMVEIGPGLGALTVPLLQRLQRLDVIEIDKDLHQPLIQKCQGLGDLTLHGQDVLSFNFASLPQPLRVVGNLPYNISTPLLFHLQQYADRIEDMIFMLQHEVAQRISAEPGSKTYGRLTVELAFYCNSEYLFPVYPQAFTPAPKVTSAMIRLTPKPLEQRPKVNKQHFSTIVRACFAMRRKTIGNTLKSLISSQVIESLGINPKARAEQLHLEEFVKIAQQLQ